MDAERTHNLHTALQTLQACAAMMVQAILQLAHGEMYDAAAAAECHSGVQGRTAIWMALPNKSQNRLPIGMSNLTKCMCSFLAMPASAAAISAADAGSGVYSLIEPSDAVDQTSVVNAALQHMSQIQRIRRVLFHSQLGARPDWRCHMHQDAKPAGWCKGMSNKKIIC